MEPAIKTELPPLERDSDGAVRVAGTRVLLDLIVSAFRNSASAEPIAEQYSAVALADVCAVIAYYLRNADAVDDHLAGRQQEAALLHSEIEPSARRRVVP